MSQGWSTIEQVDYVFGFMDTVPMLYDSLKIQMKNGFGERTPLNDTEIKSLLAFLIEDGMIRENAPSSYVATTKGMLFKEVEISYEAKADAIASAKYRADMIEATQMELQTNADALQRRMVHLTLILIFAGSGAVIAQFLDAWNLAPLWWSKVTGFYMILGCAIGVLILLLKQPKVKTPRKEK